MTPSHLPTDWQEWAIGDIAKLVGGGTPSRQKPEHFTGTTPWLTGYDLPEGRVSSIQEARESVTQQAINESATNPVPAQTVLITTRVTVGKVAVAESPLCFSQDVTGMVLHSTELCDPYYVAYFLLTVRDSLLQRNRGSTITGITRSDVANVKVPLPPPLEQRRIEAILRRADELRRLRLRADERAKALLPALFNEMFGNPATNPKGWEVYDLGELMVEGPQNGLYKPISDYGDGTPILRIDSFYDGTVRRLDRLRRVRISPDELATYKLDPGDIVINRVNSVEYLGKSALIPAHHEDIVFESNVMRLRISRETVDPVYLIRFLQTPDARRQLLSRAKHAINQSSINQEDVRRVRVPLPPPELQVEFSLRVSEVLIVEEQQATIREGLERLFHSLLSRAFIGELTAGWRETRVDELAQAAAEMRARLGEKRRLVQPELFDGTQTPSKTEPLLPPATRAELQKCVERILEQFGARKRRYWTLRDLAEHPAIHAVGLRELAEAVEMLAVLGRVRSALIRDEQGAIPAFTCVTPSEEIAPDEIHL